MSIGSISIQCCTLFGSAFALFIINQSWQKPMIRFIFISVFIGWPGGRMVRHLISNQKIPGSNPGWAIFFPEGWSHVFKRKNPNKWSVIKLDEKIL